jgi:hypothetical protein
LDDSFSKGVPPKVAESWVYGEHIASSLPVGTSTKEWRDRHGYFSFRLGMNRLIAVSGSAAREWFLDSKHLSLTHGYTLLFGLESAKFDNDHSYEQVVIKRFWKTFNTDDIVTRKLYGYYRRYLSHTVPSFPGIVDLTKEYYMQLCLRNEKILQPFEEVQTLIYDISIHVVIIFDSSII